MDNEDDYIRIDRSSLQFIDVIDDSQVGANLEISYGSDEPLNQIESDEIQLPSPVQEVAPVQSVQLEANGSSPIQYGPINVPEGLYKADKKTHKSMVTHVVLPRSLPNYLNHEMFDKQEISLLELMCDVLDALTNANILNNQTTKMIKSLHNIRTSLAPEIIVQEINRLKSGDTMAIYVKNQNCCFMVHMPIQNVPENTGKKNVIVSSFTVSLSSNVIYKNESSAIQVDFPQQSLKVEFSKMLNSMEFAKQLAFLNENRMKQYVLSHANKNKTEERILTDLVSQWLIPMLSNENSLMVTGTEFPVISKKIRDIVLGAQTNSDFTNAFQRSPIYTVIKVLLQINLTVKLGEVNGKFLYKLVILKFLTTLASFYTRNIYQTLNIDLVNQMMAKMARRIEKLSIYDPNVLNRYENARKIIVDDAIELIGKIRSKIDHQIKNLQNDNLFTSKLDALTELNFEGDAIQKVTKLREYIENRKQQTEIVHGQMEIISKRQFRHDLDNESPPSMEMLDRLKDETSIGLFLNDFENYVLYKINLKDPLKYDAKDLRTWIFKYGSKASTYYAGDQLGNSRMLLTQLKILVILDKIVFHHYHLYKDYHCGINETIFNKLILPHRIDMELADKLQRYVIKRNKSTEANKKLPGLLEYERVLPESFNVKYFDEDDEMDSILSRILEKDQQEKLRLQTKYNAIKKQADKLKFQIEPLNCTCDNVQYNYRKRAKCNKCKLEFDYQNLKLEKYEKLLPEDECLQRAIVFELAIPDEIACLRDCLFEVTKLLQDQPIKARKIKHKWTTELAAYDKSISERVFLGNSKKPAFTNNSRYAYVTTESFKSFFVENIRNCEYFALINGKSHYLHVNVQKQTMNHLTMFSVEMNSPYSNLQFALNGGHKQNHVLASQYQCSQDLILTEYVNFGSLRADGYRLQLRKLYTMIATESLSFETKSVLALIMQSMWELGPNQTESENKRWYRDAHEDFTNRGFTLEMCELIDNFVEQQKCNWKNPTKLMIAAIIAVRMFEMNSNSDVVDKVLTIFETIREVALNWLKQVQDVMDEPNNSINDLQKLRMNLVEISIAGAITFSVHFKHEYFEKIFINSNEMNKTWLQIWFEFIVTINKNTILNQSKQSRSNTKTLLRLVQRIGAGIQVKLYDVISADDRTYRESIKDFIEQHWYPSRFSKFTFTKAKKIDEPIYILVDTQTGSNNVQIDMITGEFLVNNMPVSRIPSNITERDIFSRVFDQFIFEVQQQNNDTFATSRPFKDRKYLFCYNNGKIIITERNEHNDEYELIPHTIIEEDIPYLLVQNYSHWWNRRTNIIEFRPKEFINPDFTKQSGIHYELNMNDGTLKYLKTNQLMLDVTSETYNKITKQLMLLDSSNYIHMYVEEENVGKVEMVRMCLKFIVKPSTENIGEYDIFSNEFNDMRVSLIQKYGTLYGLSHGLLLKGGNADSKNHKFIIPHGEVITSPNGLYSIVKIDTDALQLRSPPFYSYQVNETLQQLIPESGSFASWFYLAYLHAVTSYGHIEPFTGLSGTERSLQILQSAFVWSSAPYDEEALKTLKLIERLAPIRKIKKQTQSHTVQWPDHVIQHIAHDAFQIVVHKLKEDSNRLHDLYVPPKKPSKNDQEKQSKNDESDNETIDIEVLNQTKREYYRMLPFYPNLKLTTAFIEDKQIIAPHHKYEQNVENLDLLRKIANRYHEKKSAAPLFFNAIRFLIDQRDHVIGLRADVMNADILRTYFLKDITSYWISLYEIARTQQFTPEKFALILNLFAYESTDAEQAILALQTVANNPHKFRDMQPPPVNIYYLKDSELNNKQMEKILTDCYTGATILRFESHLRVFLERITRLIGNLVTVDASLFEYDQYIRQHPNHFNINEIVEQINVKKLNLLNIEKLRKFLEDVQAKIEELTENECEPMLEEWSTPEFIAKDLPQFNIDFNRKMCNNIDKIDVAIINEAKSIYQRSHGDRPIESQRSSADWWQLFKEITCPLESSHLINANLYPRIVPSLILPKLLSMNIIKTENNNDAEFIEKMKCLNNIIGAIAVKISYEQRQKRISTYVNQPKWKASLDREIANVPHQNWTPYENVDWLLFEIEQNLTIRTIQTKIAERMINPPEVGTKHSVMQLNMGEGKTAVIVPILAAKLADGYQVCSVTVLKSLFATNLKALRQYLGGMLNRKMYTFPCRRDMPLDKYVENILEIYEECKNQRGVILTLPEYRLSFQLKIYESVCKNDLEIARDYMKAHKWLQQNVRNILDESDAILQPKYQLIYTVGNQKALDGGSLRWTIVQAILKCVRNCINEFYEDYGNNKVEFDANYLQNAHIFGYDKLDDRKDVFSPFRIFDNTETEFYVKLKERIIDDFINGRLNITFIEIKNADQEQLRRLMNDKKIDDEHFNEIMNKYSGNEQNTLLILSGLLRFDILKLVFTKRYRVNYGTNPKSLRKIAVPFKAKDVASETTEFGHPDVAICLTQLSYYYSGLNDEQMYQVFTILNNQQNAIEIYETWINSVPVELIDASIKSYTGINLSDPKQRNELVFPLFRYNMLVIDFWLSNLVFPREAKTFEKKLMCTAWDLCSDQLTHKVSGFSGTNDTKNILPLSVSQNDLKELEETNNLVRKILLRAENDSYVSLAANISGRGILKELAQQQIPVLLDAGALMLELNNEQVATEWLNLVPQNDFDAAVFFNSSSDVLMTIDRNGFITEFDNSVYRNKLERCLVYLDDVHTRGTDLKFPIQWRACVTLSGDITRDKTVQACMRMRLLGNGHSIAFWASYEAHIQIREICKIRNRMPSNKDVIKFISFNSERFENANIPHWSAASVNYTKKTVAHMMHEHDVLGSYDEAPLRAIYEKCVDNEYVTLSEMYGGKKDLPLTQITDSRFDQLSQSQESNINAVTFITNIQRLVNKKLEMRTSKLPQFTQTLDEEQEKELEHELEEQRHVQRPPPAVSFQPVYHKEMEQLIKEGASSVAFKNLIKNDVIHPIASALIGKRFYADYYVDNNSFEPWLKNLCVTQDFMRIVQDIDFSDAFLRPVWWIIRLKRERARDIVLLVSSYECEHLMLSLRNSKNAIFYMYHPLLSQSHVNLLNNKRLMVTKAQQKEHLDLSEQIQIGVFAGSMYFTSDEEQKEFCSFLGLIPRPRSAEHQQEFEMGRIRPNGFVEQAFRQRPELIQTVGQCKFKQNPTKLVAALIEARYQFIRKESHVASILEKGMKYDFDKNNNHI